MQMDLPLAAGEPSPPDRSRYSLRFARHYLDIGPMDHVLSALPTGPTRPRFEFAARTHREKIHHARDRLAITNALISCVLREVKRESRSKRCFLFERLFRGVRALRKEHVSGLLASSAAVFEVQAEIGVQHVVMFRIA